jgi:hypothetical protein
MSTKTMLTALTLATLIATPAFAQKYPDRIRFPDKAQYVESGGRIIGTDPDIQVRFELRRDAPTYLGDN